MNGSILSVYCTVSNRYLLKKFIVLEEKQEINESDSVIIQGWYITSI